MLVKEKMDVPLVWIGLLNAKSGLEWLDGTPVAFLNWVDEESHTSYISDDCVGKNISKLL